MNEGEISMVEVDEKKFQTVGENRGSEWRKWDLHLHSLYSVIGSYDGVTPDFFINKIKEEEISVVGLTNYFKFDEKDYELADNLRRNGIVTFMNLELRLTNINDAKQMVDYHVVFSDQVTKVEIENFISNLDVTVGHTKKKVNALSNEEIKSTAAVNFQELIDTLTDESLNLKGKYLTAFLSRGHGNAVCGKGRDYTVYEEITRHSDFVLHSVDLIKNLEKDKLFWLGKTDEKNIYVKPLLQSSDAHCIDDIGIRESPVEGKHQNEIGVYLKDDQYYSKIPGYTWIKSEPTFEGLRQIIYEPEERVQYGYNNPSDKMRYLVIDHVDYYGNNKIYLNTGLNAIIGGRSTGKSTLINSIAKAQNNKNYKGEEHYILEESGFNVVWADGESSSEREVEFIPQEFMIDISKNREKLDFLIREIIEKKGMRIEENNYQARVESINSEISLALGEYIKESRDIRNLSKPEGNKEAASEEIRKINEQIENIILASSFTDQEHRSYTEICNQLGYLSFLLGSMQREKEHAEELKKAKFYVDVNLTLLSEEKQELFRNKLDELHMKSNKEWNVFVDEQIVQIENTIEQTQVKIIELQRSPIYLKGKSLELKNYELKRLKEQLDFHMEIVRDFETYLERKNDGEIKIKEKYDFIINKFFDYFNAIKGLQDTFKIEENDLKIEITPSLVPFVENIDYLYARSLLNNNFIEKFDKLMSQMKCDELRAFFSQSLKEENFSFNKGKNIEDLIRDIFGVNWFKYNYTVTYQNDEFQDMSQGKKSFVILKLLLEFSDDKKPVLIDQPEDSLDNRAIYHELRKYLLDTKKKRQIIIVTHNPNVVVGADAENVIVAHQQSNLEKNRNGKKFQYINGALENTKGKDSSGEFVMESQGIREHIFDVLEGGEEAFAKREQKYNYRKS